MSASVIPRSAGVGLLVYAITTFVAFMFSGAPGGDYSSAGVADYLDPGHAAIAFTLWYIAALGALALVLFGTGIRHLPGIGRPLSAITTAATALSVAGAVVAGGIVVGAVEGGDAVQRQATHAVIYLISEIGNLLAVCAPALCVGVIAIVLAIRVRMPMWLRVVCVIGGIGGILAPFFLTYFVYLLAVCALGITMISGSAVRTPLPQRVPAAA